MYLLIFSSFSFQLMPPFFLYNFSFKIFPYNEVLFILFIIFSWQYLGTNKFINSFYNTKFALSFTLLFLLFALGIIWSDDLFRAYIILKTQMYLLIVPLTIAIYSKHEIKKLITFILMLATVFSIYIILSSYNLFNLPSSIILYSNQSPFINTMYSASMLTLCITLIYLNMGKKYLFFQYSSITLIIVAICLLCNRSSLLGFVIAISLVSLFRYRPTFFKKFLIITTAILIFFTTLISFNPNCFNKLNNINKTLQFGPQVANGASISCRIDYIKKSFELWLQHPIIGVGTGDLLLEMKNMMGEKEYIKFVTEPCHLGSHNQTLYFDSHNTYMTQLMLFGPLGVFIYLFMLYMLFKAGIQLHSKELQIISITVALASIPITLFYTSSNFVLLFSILVACLYTFYKDEYTNETNF